jgi:hypothetical protein
MIKIENDGIDHINIYSRGATEIGRKLSNFSYTPFVLPDHGLFNSVEGFWYWLTRRDDRLRFLDGYEAKKLGRKLPVIHSYKKCEYHLFQQEIKSAIDVKLNTHREIRIGLFASELPLVHYYVVRNEIERSINIPDNSVWLMDYFTEIRGEANPNKIYKALNINKIFVESKVESLAPQMSLF